MKNSEPETARQSFRHELKYLISDRERVIVKERLEQLLKRDANAESGSYFIRSLYFDNASEQSYEEKLSGVSSRKKYRIRIYNHDTSLIRLECKRKEEAYIYKRSVVLTKEEMQALTKGRFDFLQKRSEPLCQEFYLECVLNQMKPKVIVDYDREPYVYPFGDVRVTFDSHVRAGILGTDLLDKALPVREALEPNQLIMEVKFTQYLPSIVRDAIQVQDSICTSASKYVMCMDKKKVYSFT